MLVILAFTIRHNIDLITYTDHNSIKSDSKQDIMYNIELSKRVCMLYKFCCYIESFIGVKFKYMSHNPDNGLDCFGLLDVGLKFCGIDIFNNKSSIRLLYRLNDCERLYDIFNIKYFNIKSDDKPNLGSVLVLKTKFHLPHVAIVTDIIDGIPYITHSDSDIRCVAKNIFDGSYKKSLINILNINFPC